MYTKRIMRWVIVLFLLAALPVMTAVMAQEEEPAAQEPAVVEPEVVIPWQKTETEPNDGFGSADKMVIGSVGGGIMDKANDVDYFKLEQTIYYSMFVEDTNYPSLINLVTDSTGNAWRMCLYSFDFVEMGCKVGWIDELLYFNLEAEKTYYLKVENYRGLWGSNIKYQILLSHPLLISAAPAGLGTGTVADIPFQAGDIMAWSEYHVNNTTYEKWVMLFDLSDTGVKGNLANLAGGWRNSDYLLMSFTANITLPGISGPVTPWEVVVFDPIQLGPNTGGTFQRWWPGRDHDLTLSAEKLDAIDWPNWSGRTRLFASTTGTAKVTKPSGAVLKLADEDVGLWSASALEKWAHELDLTTVTGLSGAAAGDVVALSKTVSSEWMWYGTKFGDWSYYLVIQGSGTCGGDPVTQKDIFEVRYAVDGEDLDLGLYCAGIAWHGSDHGWNYNIDAIEWYNHPYGQ